MSKYKLATIAIVTGLLITLGVIAGLVLRDLFGLPVWTGFLFVAVVWVCIHQMK